MAVKPSERMTYPIFKENQSMLLNKDVATNVFYAIGNYNPDDSFDSNGIAIFDNGATGELSFLSNSVGIYKDQVDKNGTGTFLM